MRPVNSLKPLGNEQLSNESTLTRWARPFSNGPVRSKPGGRVIEQMMSAFTAEQVGQWARWDATGRINVLHRLSDSAGSPMGIK